MNKKLVYFIPLLVVIAHFAFTYTYDTSTPAGSADPTQGDDRIREVKAATAERMAVDHTWPASGTTYDGATVGYHKALRLPEQASDVTTPASYGSLYTKDSGTQPELYYREESDGDVIQITSNGSLNVTPTSAASAAEVLTGTEAAKYVAPSTFIAHEGAVKAWANYTGTGSEAYNDEFNFTGSITDNGTGDKSLSIDTDFGSANYVGVCSGEDDVATRKINCQIKSGKAVGSVTVQTYEDGGALIDVAEVNVILIGDR